MINYSIAITPVIFLIYVSKVTRLISTDELASLQRIAHENNRLQGISGCLVYSDGYFMQMLEGKRDVVLTLVEKIKADSRHHDIRIVMEGPAQRRFFTDWGMVLRNQSQLRTSYEGLNVGQWRRKRFTFLDLADDPDTCFAYITAYSGEYLLTTQHAQTVR